MDPRIIDFPEYPWKTLNVHKDFSYTFNISPGKEIEEEHFWQDINSCAAAINFPPLCTSHYYF